MEDKLLALLGNNVFVSVLGAMGTTIMAAIGFKIRDDREFRKSVYKKTDDLEEKIHENHAFMLENYPKKEDMRHMEQRIIQTIKMSKDK